MTVAERAGGAQPTVRTNGKGKLTWQQAVEIRSAAAAGERQRSIAARYGVSEATISQIVRGIIWRSELTSPASLTERLLRRIRCDLPSKCWIWLGYVDAAGYGRIQTGHRTEPVAYTHRVAYEAFVGPLPVGMDTDHLCRNRRCCNPTHLEPVPHRVNALRGAAPMIEVHLSGACQRGHPRNEENTYWRRDRPGHWLCRACQREDRHAAGLGRPTGHGG